MLTLPADKVDEVRAFIAYGLFGGDARRAALVARTTPEIIESLAHDHNWKAKLTGRERVDTDVGAAEARLVNRAGMLLVADRMREVVTRIIDTMAADKERIPSMCLKTDPDSGLVMFDPKSLLDLIKGLQLVGDISYRALGDKIAQDADTSDAKSSTDSKGMLELYGKMMDRFGSPTLRAAEVIDVVPRLQNENSNGQAK